MKKSLLAVSLIAMLGVAVPSNVHAQWAVIDPANLAQNITTATQTVKAYHQQYQQLYEQIRMNIQMAQELRNQATNMVQDPIDIYQSIRGDYERLKRLMSDAQVDYGNVARVAQQHDEVFGNNKNFSSLPDRNHYEGFQRSVQLAEQQSEEAIILLNQAELQEKNRAIVANAQETSDNADGYMQVSQAATKIQTASFNTLDSINNYMAQETKMYATANSIEQRERRSAYLKRNQFKCGAAVCDDN